MRFFLLLTAALAVPCFAAPEATTLALERQLPSSTEVGIPDVVTFVADGEVIPAPAPTIGGKLLDLVTSPTGLGTIATIVLGALGGLLGTNEIRRRRVALGVFHAFHIVEDIGAEIPGDDAFDKVARGLKAADDYLVANGWRPLKPGEQQVAKLGFQSLNGASKLAEKVQTAALEAALPAEPTQPVPQSP